MAPVQKKELSLRIWLCPHLESVLVGVMVEKAGASEVGTVDSRINIRQPPEGGLGTCDCPGKLCASAKG